jgi:hypothetical protein
VDSTGLGINERQPRDGKNEIQRSGHCLYALCEVVLCGKGCCSILSIWPQCRFITLSELVLAVP